MTPPVTDLTTLAAVRAHQQKTDATNTAQDALIGDMISVASEMIMRYTEREFAPAATVASRSYRYNGRGVLDMAPDDATAITSVVIDSDTTGPTTLTTDQYKTWPTRRRDGVITHLHIIGIGDRAVTSENYPVYREVTVTGTWGWPSVPDTVERACILLTMDLISRTSSFRHADMDEMMPSAGGAAMPLHVRTMLASFRRHSTGT